MRKGRRMVCLMKILNLSAQMVFYQVSNCTPIFENLFSMADQKLPTIEVYDGCWRQPAGQLPFILALRTNLLTICQLQRNPPAKHFNKVVEYRPWKTFSNYRRASAIALFQAIIPVDFLFWPAEKFQFCRRVYSGDIAGIGSLFRCMMW